MAFTDGTTENYFVDVTAENIYDRNDDKGHQYPLLKEMINHKKSEDAVSAADGHITTRTVPKKATRGSRVEVRG